MKVCVIEINYTIVILTYQVEIVGVYSRGLKVKFDATISNENVANTSNRTNECIEFRK